MRKISSLRKLKNEMVIFDNDSQYLYESVEQLHETNQQMNQDLMMRKSKDIKLEKVNSIFPANITIIFLYLFWV